MPRYVAFLRGINVGGHVVKKGKLQETFHSQGFRNVLTYKQSGNVIFEACSGSAEEIKKKIEIKLSHTLGYNVAIFIRTIAQLKDIVASEPFKKQNKEGTSFLVTFLADAPAKFTIELPTTIPKSTAQIISEKGTEVFSVTHGGGEGALPNPFIESKLKAKATTRNLNVIREIVEKYGS
ncbi:MAG: DUF1697 domain-containing protein [Candidatus Bathyarchaeia archaeon]|jgi:uncharacterized protein (DUF1697 family)